MSLTLYNTLTRRKEPFEPIDPDNVRMYVCGPTVYDFAHIGNARPVIVFDVLFRLLRHVYGAEHVTYVRNITDVDDKINARAADDYPDLPLNEAIRKVTEQTTAQFHADIAALGVLPPTVEPRATDHIAEMKALIEALVAKGHAYVAEGHVLFDVPSMPDYGKLSNRSLDEMEAGARVEVAPYKKDPMDFVLWKPSKPGEPALAVAVRDRRRRAARLAHRVLGDGGQASGRGLRHSRRRHRSRLSAPRERDRADRAARTARDVMAHVWMHNGFLQVEGEKMSKSLGNFITIHELLETKSFGGQPVAWPRSALGDARRRIIASRSTGRRNACSRRAQRCSRLRRRCMVSTRRANPNRRGGGGAVGRSQYAERDLDHARAVEVGQAQC